MMGLIGFRIRDNDLGERIIFFVNFLPRGIRAGKGGGRWALRIFMLARSVVSRIILLAAGHGRLNLARNHLFSLAEKERVCPGPERIGSLGSSFRSGFFNRDKLNFIVKRDTGDFGGILPPCYKGVAESTSAKHTDQVTGKQKEKEEPDVVGIPAEIVDKITTKKEQAIEDE